MVSKGPNRCLSDEGRVSPRTQKHEYYEVPRSTVKGSNDETRLGLTDEPGDRDRSRILEIIN